MPDAFEFFTFEVGANYKNAQRILYNIPLAAMGWNEATARKVGDEIVEKIKIDLKDQEKHPYANKPRSKSREGIPHLIETVSRRIENGNLIISAGGPLNEYAKWVEFGSSKADPHPFMSPSINEVIGEEAVRKQILNDVYTLAKSRAMRGGASNGPFARPSGQGDGLSGLMALSAAGMTVFSGMLAGALH